MSKRKNRNKAPSLSPGAAMHPMTSAQRSPNGQVAVYDPRSGQNRNKDKPSDYNNMVAGYVRDVIETLDTSGNWFSPFQPMQPFGPPNVDYPRVFDYRSGINLDIAPARLQLYQLLQQMSRSWGLLRTVIETRKDQFMRMPFEFQIKGKPKKSHPRIDQLNDFFRRPDGKNSFSRWKRLLLEDLLVIDAPALFKWQAIDGTPLAYDIIAGDTIKPLIDDAGRRPTAPDPAYQQIIKGLPMTNWTEDDIRYIPMRPTPQMPIYGYSPVEQILGEVTAGIKRLTYQISFWSEGSMPEIMVMVPEGWTPNQVVQYQGFFDSMMSGNIPYKSKVRFMPGGMKPFDIKNANGEALHADIDEWWARLICYAFGVSPQPFIKMMNRSTAQSAQQAAEEEGLHPLMLWFKEEVMDPIIQEDFGFDEIEFTWTPNPEVDQNKQMTVLTGYVKEGIIARNEARDQIGFGPVPGGEIITVDTAQGPVTMKEYLAGTQAQSLDVPNELQRTQEKHDAETAKTEAEAVAAKRRPVAKPSQPAAN